MSRVPRQPNGKITDPGVRFEPLPDNDEAEDLLQIHPKTPQGMARRGEVVGIRIGNPNLPYEPLLDDERAAQFLGGIHPKTVQRMARSGDIPAYRVGRFWRYRASELNDWLQLQSTSQSLAWFR